MCIIFSRIQESDTETKIRALDFIFNYKDVTIGAHMRRLIGFL